MHLFSWKSNGNSFEAFRPVGLTYLCFSGAVPPRPEARTAEFYSERGAEAPATERHRVRCKR